MQKFYSDIFSAVKKILDLEDNNDLNFYSKISALISSLYANSNVAIFFIESDSCKLVGSNVQIDDYKISAKLLKSLAQTTSDYILSQSTADNLLKRHTLLAKLSIQESLFGFCLLSCEDKIDDEIICSFSALTKIISYKIKDFELAAVSKMQLKAMQDAMLEKQDAFNVIRKQHKKLQEIDKTKNLFLANISHELRTPLNAIIGFSQALSAKMFGDLNKKQSEYVKDIQISGLHLLGMINEILDLSKIESNVMKYTPIVLEPSRAINEVLEILLPLYENKNIKVTFINNYSGKIFADNQKFQQILYNLLSNAIKFTPEYGTIEILHFKEKNKYILKIKDSGIGIDKKNHGKIFKKFVHIQNEYANNLSSTGLGLAITKELVKLHKGKITLESELNKGSCFTMEFSNIAE